MFWLSPGLICLCSPQLHFSLYLQYYFSQFVCVTVPVRQYLVFISLHFRVYYYILFLFIGSAKCLCTSVIIMAMGTRPKTRSVTDNWMVCQLVIVIVP